MHSMQLIIKRDKDFQWTEEACQAFNEMEKILSSSLVLALLFDDGH